MEEKNKTGTWFHKLLQFRLKDEHAHPDSLVFNLLNLLFWAIILGILVGMLALWG